MCLPDNFFNSTQLSTVKYKCKKKNDQSDQMDRPTDRRQKANNFEIDKNSKFITVEDRHLPISTHRIIDHKHSYTSDHAL